MARELVTQAAMQKNSASAAPPPARLPRLGGRIPVQFAEAAALPLSVSAPSRPVVPPDRPAGARDLSASNKAALSLAAGSPHAGESWDDHGVIRSGSPLSDWPL